MNQRLNYTSKILKSVGLITALILASIFLGLSFYSPSRRLTGLLHYAGVTIDVSSFDPEKVTIEKSSVFFPSPEDFDYCEKNNIVFPGGNVGEGIPEKRPFSITPADFIPKHGISLEKQCLTVEKALTAIKHGIRVWSPNHLEDVSKDNKKLASAQRQAIPSTFIPAECDLLAMSPQDMCNTINKFSTVALTGDSLSRHVRSGLLTGLSNDLVGGNIVDDKEEGAVCRCDGAYSEFYKCRGPVWSDENGVRDIIPYHVGLCPHLDTKDQVTVQWREWVDLTEYECKAEDSEKPYLLILNGGLHYNVDAKETYTKFIKKKLQNVKNCVDSGREVYVIWNSMSLQAQVMDQWYFRQSMKIVIEFNEEMETILSQNGVHGVALVDWTSFTKEAQTSDGVHYLGQVNYFKAQYLIYIANLMQKEKMTVRLTGPDFTTE